MKRNRFAAALAHHMKRHPFLYRLRYAFITRLGKPIGSSEPTDGFSDRAPAIFNDTLGALELTGTKTFADALEIAFDLASNHAPGPGIGLDSGRTLEKIYTGGAGVCSDYTQAFLGLCHAARLPCREWGLCESFRGWGVGHTVSEVYSTEHQKWIFLDPFHSLYARHAVGAKTPLSMTEMVDLTVAGRRDEIELVDIDPDKKSPVQRETYLERYFKGQHVFFVLENNDVFGQDPFLRLGGKLPLPLVHAAMLVTGRYQQFHVYTNEENRQEMEQRVGDLRRWLGRILTLGALLAALLMSIFLAWPW